MIPAGLLVFSLPTTIPNTMSANFFPLYVVVHFFTTLWCIHLYRTRHAPWVLIVAMIAAALVYDNAIIFLGASIGVGELLETLSWPRFIMHGLLTPFMLLAVSGMAEVGGIRWVQTTWWKVLLWVLIIGGVAIGAYEHVIGAEIVPACGNGVVRYTQNLSPSIFCFEDQVPLRGAGPPIPSIVGTIVALVVGIALWRRSGWIWLALGSILMFAAAGVPMTAFGLAPGNGGEVILLLSFAATYARFAQRRATA